MNNWHSIRFLFIGALAVILIVSYASSIIQGAYSYNERQSNNEQDCSSTPGKGGIAGKGGIGGTSTGGKSGLAGVGGTTGEGQRGGLGGTGGNSGNGGDGGNVNAGNGGNGGRGGNAETICLLLEPEISIPSGVPIKLVLERPNWNNALNAAENILSR